MANQTVSVVIPVWNEEKYLPDCISSIQSQTFKDFEVIALDNHSTDNTIKMCRAVGWKIVQQKQKGISAARAEGFTIASGQIIASTNADCKVPPQWLETLVNKLSDPNVTLAYGPVIFKEGATQGFYKFMNSLSRIFFYLNHILKADHPIGENFATTKKAYEKVGGFNLKLPTAEDVELCSRLSKIGTVKYDPKLIVLTSARRLSKQKLGFFTHHTANFIRLKLFGTASSSFDPIR